MPLSLFVIIGIVFGSLAGACAFLITFAEWQKYKFEGWQLWREPFIRGGYAFLVFFVLSIALWYALGAAIGTTVSVPNH